MLVRLRNNVFILVEYVHPCSHASHLWSLLPTAVYCRHSCRSQQSLGQWRRAMDIRGHQETSSSRQLLERVVALASARRPYVSKGLSSQTEESHRLTDVCSGCHTCRYLFFRPVWRDVDPERHIHRRGRWSHGSRSRLLPGPGDVRWAPLPRRRRLTPRARARIPWHRARQWHVGQRSPHVSRKTLRERPEQANSRQPAAQVRHIFSGRAEGGTTRHRRWCEPRTWHDSDDRLIGTRPAMNSPERESANWWWMQRAK